MNSPFSMTACQRPCSEGLLPGVRVVEACDFSLLHGSPGGYTRHFRNYSREDGSASENEVKVGSAEPTSSICFVIECLCDTKASVYTESIARYLCREE